MKVEMIEFHDRVNAHGIGRSDILEVKQEHVEQYKSFYKSFAEANLENMIQDRALLKLMQLKLKHQISKLTERIKLYSNKLHVSRQYFLDNKVYNKEEFDNPDSNENEINVAVKDKDIKSFNEIIKSIELDKDTNAFWRSKIKELVKERELNKNYLKVLNRFHQTLKRSIYDLEKDIYMKQKENKLNG